MRPPATSRLERGAELAFWGAARVPPTGTCRQSCPTISVDYMFLHSEVDEDRAAPLVAMIAHGTRVKSSRVAPRKGAMPRSVDLTAEDIRSWGIRRFVFKSDQEPSILALKARIIEALGSDFEVVPETSAVGGHESNGTVERAIRAIGNTVRTLKIATEQSCNVELDSTCPALQWLVQHAGAILSSRFEVGADGRTPYQRLKGKECKAKIPSFGEQVFYGPLRPSGARLKLDAKYREGTFLGIKEGTNEYYVGAEAGVARSADIRRKPPSQRWSGAELLAVKGTPNFPNPNEEGAEVPMNPGGVPVVMESPVGVIPTMPTAPFAPTVARKRVYITRQDIRTFGWTRGCPRCAADMSNRPSTMAHSEECRLRVEAALTKTEGRKKLRVADERRGVDEPQTLAVPEGVPMHHIPEGEAEDLAITVPDESTSMILSKDLKRKADPEFMPPDDPRLEPDPSTEPTSTRADESAGTTGGSSSSAPAGQRSTRSRSPPRFGQVREVVPASAAGSGRAAEGADNTAPRASADPADADMELHSLEHEISILETSLSRLCLGELNSIVEVFGPGGI